MLTLPALPCLLYLISPFWRPFFFISLIIQVGYIISRGISLGRLPLVGLHDTLTFLGFATALTSLIFYGLIERKKSYKWFVVILAVLISVAGLAAKPMNYPLPDVIKTIWFEFHVILAFLSYGFFGIGFCIGFISLLFSDKELEPLQYRAILIGYFIFSISMIFGGVWAFLSWATYWIWTPKELWTAMLWLFLTLYLHLRYRPWWKRGRGIIIFGIFNYIVVLFTYLGVGLLMKSSHSF